MLTNTDTAKHWDDGLVGTARRIAELEVSPLRVLAGPGTGKTFSMMRRVARFIEDGVDPNRILVCTFTRTAATDLKKALAELGIEGVESVQACTIHSLCFSMLSKAEVMEITRRVPRTLLAFEQRFMLEDLKGGVFGGIRDCEKRLKAFEAAWARRQTEDPGWPQDNVDRRFQASLLSWLQFHQAMLVGELVPASLRFLVDNPAAVVKQAFDQVLVDEYQDLNRADQAVIDEISENGALTVIGDENQSIYSFRFAHPEGVTQFDASHSGTHDEQLVECRRCPKAVVELANSLIINNVNRADRPIQALPGNPDGDVYIVQWSSLMDESQGLAKYISHKISQGEVLPGRVLVLAPRRQFGYDIRDELNKLNVPAHSFFHEEELDNESSQEVFSLLTLLANRDDRVALRCWCGFGSNSLNSGAWQRVWKKCADDGDTPWGFLDELLSGKRKMPHTKPVVERFALLQQRLQSLQGLTGHALVNALFPHGNDWAVSLRNLSFTFTVKDFSASQLLDHLRSNITQPELPTDVDYVRVMSLHKSKGLTADMVVIVGCIDGLVPTLPDNVPLAEEERVIEEQRRLFYVALTRTRSVLVLSSVTTLPRNLAYRIRARITGGVKTHASAVASRFLAELGSSRPAATTGKRFLKDASIG